MAVFFCFSLVILSIFVPSLYVAGYISSKTDGEQLLDAARSDLWDTVLDKLDDLVSDGFDGPEDCDTSKISFYVTNNYPGCEIKLDEDLTSCYPIGRPIKIFVHGWSSTREPVQFHSILQKYSTNGNAAILVDWTNFSSDFLYYTSAIRTRTAGCAISKLLEYLTHNNATGSNSIHLIGHSLGAHVCGFAGMYYKNTGLGEISRITGLDPAYPGFRGQNDDRRLSADDAVLVDVIHTNGVLDGMFQNDKDLLHLGFQDPLGHYDFYPGGGAKQPGCSSADFGPTCNHQRAVDLFHESIPVNGDNTKRFYSQRCEKWTDFTGQTIQPCYDDYNYMGEGLELDAHSRPGKYYFCTNAASPYDKGNDGSISCKPTLCNLLRSSRNANGAYGFDVSITDIVYSEEIAPNELEFVGVDEIWNDSPVTVRQIFCFEPSWNDKKYCASYKNCGASEPVVYRSESESEFSVQREVIVPPYTKVHMCSTVAVNNDLELTFDALAHYTGEGFWPTEIARILALDGIIGTIDEETDSVIASVNGKMKIGLALEPQFMVSTIENDGLSDCIKVSSLIVEKKKLKASLKINATNLESWSRIAEIEDQLQVLIYGSKL